MTNAAIFTNNGITLIIDNKDYFIPNSHKHFKNIKELYKQNKFAEIQSLIDIGTTIANYSKDKLTVKDGVVYYNSNKVSETLNKRILQMIEDDFDLEFMCIFLENLYQNPSYNSVQELYTFLEKNNIPLTQDGCFIAYKKVTKNFKDHYSGTIDNSVGEIVRMDRNKVDDNSTNTCSYGLHVCSFSYLNCFGNSDDPIILVKINPKDVVSVPKDYNNTKMRICEYEVIAIHKNTKQEAFTNDSVVAS